jgi:hypothetical protein
VPIGRMNFLQKLISISNNAPVPDGFSGKMKMIGGDTLKDKRL